jgi:hypothetical protein
MDALRRMGYTVLAIPTKNVAPLQLLVKTSKGVVESLNARIDDLFEPVNIAIPALSEDMDLPDEISSMESLDLSITSHLNLLRGLSKYLPADFSGSLTAGKDKNYSFKLNHPKKTYINQIKLDAFIHDAELNKSAKGILEQLKDDDIYVITEVLKAKSFTIDEENANKTESSLNASVDTLGEVKSQVNMNKEKSKLLEYNGEHYLTFGIKASRIQYNKGSFFSSKPAGFRLRTADDIVVVRGDEDFPTEQLNEEIVDLTQTPTDNG